ncbi:hypothetical protein [Aquisalinus flavus]|uniref:Acyl carrier protein n=1 Tax=Aquisalinus flavus TaxID=1526572 RepID=A0A8J2V430_9PROT|nr:hypothetical protein [Aquisalinus flavus]MBD0427554.1 hypothetical protein [Aquisalinus flavus]UNE47346.1 hypothetical protein FF099_04360 [Aquisalinus flavus]GGD01891.1 hypothetical protein GCM10011342_08670 [Aquisalinus flavus]
MSEHKTKKETVADAPNTVGLDDDLDGIELLEAIERCFRISYLNEEAEKIITVGDLYDSVSEKLAVLGGGNKCHTSMAFYRLRRSMPVRPDTPAMTPTTKLAHLSTHHPRSTFKLLKNRTGFDLPDLALTLPGKLSVLFMIATFLIIPWLGLTGIGTRNVIATMTGFFLAALPLRWMDQGLYKQDTLGDLANAVAERNFGLLAQMGGRIDHQSVWDVIVDIAIDHSSIDISPDEITRSTYLLECSLPRAA